MPLTRRVWTQAPPSRVPHAAVVFLDAELYIERVKAPQVVRESIENRSIPEVVAVYVSNQSAAARHSDYVCNPDYAAFIAQDVLPWMFSRYPEIDRDQIVISGLSLSGLAAAYMAVTFSTHFSAAICQSPSFWWENERFGASLPQSTNGAARFWVSVGDLETEKGVSHPPSGMLQRATQIEACERACAALRSRGFDCEYRTFNGGHDRRCWQEDLSKALPWAWKSEPGTKG